MILSDKTIRKYLKSKKIIILPNPKAGDFKSCGVKLHLGSEVLVPKPGQKIDLNDPKKIIFTKKPIPPKGYILKSGAFILVSTLQRYKFSTKLVGMLDGRSSLARVGLTIHGTSQMVEEDNRDPHVITLEIKNQGPFDLILHAGMQIGMLCFFEMTTSASEDLKFNYAHQHSALPPDPKALKQK